MSCFINESMHGNLSVGRHVTVIAHPYSSIAICDLSVSTDGCVWLHLENGLYLLLSIIKVLVGHWLKMLMVRFVSYHVMHDNKADIV